MPRKSKNVHGKPANAGVKNMPKDYADKRQDTDGINAGVMPVYRKGMENRQNYKGLWDEESLSREIMAYFDYCEVNEVKMAKVGISLWLGMSKQMMFEWAKDKKYGFKFDLINQAFDVVEASYVGRIEKYPTGNIFLLKTSHGHIETSKVDVQTNGVGATLEDVKDTISKLGLDK